MTPETRSSSLRRWWPAGALLLVATATFAWSRAGLLDLPAIPSGLTPEAAGLADLADLKRLNDYIWSGAAGGDVGEPPPAVAAAARLVREGIAAVQCGEAEVGLEEIRTGVRMAPTNLVLGNAYRMLTFQLRRDFLRTARQGTSLVPQFPPHLDGQPIAFFEDVDKASPCRETKLQLALAWVDTMLMFPALEIKAPASVESVDLLTSVIDHGNPGYIPALFGRGLNHLHRPARLVWPESAKTPADAAAQDIGRCVAIGRKFGGGSDRLRATLAIALGDAYVKAGRLGVARSWWQIAQNACGDDDLQQAVRRRYGWQDEEILDRLEAELDRSRGELDHPMTDLSMMWN